MFIHVENQSSTFSFQIPLSRVTPGYFYSKALSCTFRRTRSSAFIFKQPLSVTTAGKWQPFQVDEAQRGSQGSLHWQITISAAAWCTSAGRPASHSSLLHIHSAASLCPLFFAVLIPLLHHFGRFKLCQAVLFRDKIIRRTLKRKCESFLFIYGRK